MTDAPALPSHERIALLDVVRGFALLGILIMNIPGFGTSFYAEADGSHLWPGMADQATEAIRDALFSGKFNSMFSMLFGLGFTLQFARMEERAPGRARILYLRRLLVLLALGLIHGMVFWTGDILTHYALLGLLVVLPLRHASPRTLLIAMGACFGVQMAMALMRHAFTTPESIATLRLSAQAWETSNNLAYGHGTFLQAVAEHAREFVHVWIEPWSLSYNLSTSSQYAFTMILGVYVGRMGWLQRIPELMPAIRRLTLWALAVGLGSGIAFEAIGLAYRTADATMIRAAGRLGYWLSRPSLMIFYVLAIVQLMQRPTWARRFKPLGAAGRMPLTNYLMQTAIGTWLFYGWGLGLWDRVGPAASLLLAFAIFFLVQVPVSIWWLDRYDRGPLEAIWARLTYGKPTREPAN